VCFATYCRIQLRNTGETQSSSDLPENEEVQMPCTRAAVLSVRFIARQHRGLVVPDSENDEEELVMDESSAAAAAGDEEENDDDDSNDISTPQQVDWIVATSHADNTIRFRNADVSYLLLKLFYPNSCVGVRAHSFPVRVISLWNRLSSSALLAENIVQFIT